MTWEYSIIVMGFGPRMWRGTKLTVNRGFSLHRSLLADQGYRRSWVDYIDTSGYENSVWNSCLHSANS